MSRSPFFYVGDKYKLIPQLKNYFPNKINTLYEPFCGGGSVFLNIYAEEYIANDNNEYMIKLHKYFQSFKNRRNDFFILLENTINKYGFSASFIGKNVPDELKKQYVKTYYAKYNKQSYSHAREDYNKDKENMILLYVLLIYGFNHMLRFNSKGDFNLPVGNVDYNKNVVNALNSYFDFVENKKIMYFNEDFESFVKNIEFNEDDFIYFDPPYLISQSEYNKSWTTQEENRLLNLLDYLDSKGIKFGLSNFFKHKGKTNDLLIKWSRKYKVIKINSNYISYHDNTIKDSEEVLIVNYEKKNI